MLKRWKKEYLERGPFTGKRVHGCAETYSAEQKQAAVNYYLEHGKCIAKTVRALGYPKARFLLSRWIDELAPQEKRVVDTKVAKDKTPQVSGSAKPKNTPKEQHEHVSIREFYDWRAYVAPRVKIVPRTYVLAGEDVKNLRH